MAYIEGNPLGAGAGTRRLGVLALSAALVVLLIFMSSPKQWNPLSGIALGAGLFFLIAFVYFKLDPYSWKILFAREKYVLINDLDRRIIESLATLDDSYLALINTTIELFRVDYLVMSRKGIYVLSRLETMDMITCVNGTLMAETFDPETEVSRLWQTCHFLRILFKKTYNVDVLPHPVLVSPRHETVIIDNCGGLSVASSEDIVPFLQNHNGQPLPEGVAENFALFLKKRYVSAY